MGALLDIEDVAHGHPKALRELQELYDEIERLKRNATTLEDEKNAYLDYVGDALGQDHDGETLWDAAQRVLSERDRLRADNEHQFLLLEDMETAVKAQRAERERLRAEIDRQCDELILLRAVVTAFSETIYYKGEDDDVGSYACCGEISYYPHAPDCIAMMALRR